MPFQPRVLPDSHRPDPRETANAPGDAISAFLDERDREEQRGYEREDRKILGEERRTERASRSRADVIAELEYRRLLEEEGLEPFDSPGGGSGSGLGDRKPGDLPGGDPLEHATPGIAGPYRPGGGFQSPAVAPPPEEKDRRTAKEIEAFGKAPPYGREIVKNEFARQAELGPQAVEKPVVLPGAFSSGMGFARRPIYQAELEPPAPPPQAAQDPELVTIAGQQFRRTGRSSREREAQARQDEIDALIQAGVDPEIAGFAADDDVLRRSILTADEEEAGERTYTYEELLEAGLPEQLARIGALDPSFAEEVLGEHLTRTRPDRPSSGGSSGGFTALQTRNIAIEETEAIVRQAVARAGGNPDVVLEIAAETVRQDPDLARHVSGAMIEAMVLEELGGGSSSSSSSGARRLPPDVEERRDAILDYVSPPAAPWQQGIVDRLAGIGPGGQLVEPMTVSELLEGFRQAGKSEEELALIRQYMATFPGAASMMMGGDR